jgi:predicted DCC family thiol-disulfide oxidoreductase YuxK
MMPAARRQRTIQLCQAAKASGDLVREVSNTVRLKRVGQGFNGLCPLHADKFPSLWVYPDGHWHCYGCPPAHNHGSILDWRQALYGETLTEAATAILQQFGPPPEYRSTPAHVRAGRAWEPDDALLTHWDTVYQAVWTHLTLDAPEQAELADRGLDRPALWRAHGLQSVPRERRQWPSRIGQSVAGVPGFSTRDEGTWHGPAGLVIPVRLSDGRMVGAQIRVRKDQRQTGKYVWWSTPPEARQEDGALRYPDGAKAWVIAHVYGQMEMDHLVN